MSDAAIAVPENHFPTQYQEFIHLSRYARWIEDKGRRETWPETVGRYVDFMFDKQIEGKLAEYKEEVRQAIIKLEVMPSMRCMMTAGSALEKDNAAAYNCSYLAIDDPCAFDEMLYILMCGSGVGFSVERQFIDKLPVVAENLRKSLSTIAIEDSKIGWANAFRELITMLYQGRIPKFDASAVRPAGARLKTFGGRASGPGPLLDLFNFCIMTFKNAAGRKLNSIECHDICCKIGEIVVVGGVRRSALISLSNPSDDRMRYAKSGEWWKDNQQRSMANNSICYTEKPECDRFMREWLSLMDSKSGERGIFNRAAAKRNVEKYGRRDPNHEFGSNPCNEIILRSCGFCNLSEMVVRPEDTVEDLKRKVRLATIIGTMQSSMTNFRYLRSVWKTNAEEERLLGVSMTGIMDNVLTAGKDGGKREGTKKLAQTLSELRQYAVEVNKEFAAKIGVTPSTAITCVKPSGTVSQLVDCASGIHPRFSHYYIRTVRADIKDPLAKLMQALGFPCEPDVTKPEHNVVFSFPMKCSENSVVVDDVSALDQLELWLVYQRHWTEHKPSITVYVKDSEWMEVGAWVYRNFDEVSGIAFLPYSGHTYRQAPYQEIDKAEYEELVKQMPADADWSLLSAYEVDDSAIIGYKELACSGGKCEEVDVTRSEPPTILGDGSGTKQ